MNRQTITKISAVVITFALVAILLSQIQVADIIVTLAGIDPLYLIAGFILYVCSYFFRALRFYILLNREVGLRDLFNIVCVHNMVNNILPARTGELSYIYLLKKLHNKKTGEGIATLFVARVFDFISISLLFFVSALMIQDLPEIIMKAVWAIAFLMVFIVVFLVAMLYFGESFFNIVRRFFRRFNLEEKHFADYLLRKGEETVESFEKIKTNGQVIGIITVSIGIWVSVYALNYMLVLAMHINLEFFAVLLGSTFLIFATILPIQGIGGFGTYEGGWVVGFMAVGLTKDVAISSGFVVHVIGIFYYVLLGLYGYQFLIKN